jgi:hypothetical protein
LYSAASGNEEIILIGENPRRKVWHAIRRKTGAGSRWGNLKKIGFFECLLIEKRILIK